MVRVIIDIQEEQIVEWGHFYFRVNPPTKATFTGDNPPLFFPDGYSVHVSPEHSLPGFKYRLPKEGAVFFFKVDKVTNAAEENI